LLSKEVLIQVIIPEKPYETRLIIPMYVNLLSSACFILKLNVTKKEVHPFDNITLNDEEGINPRK